MSENRELDRVIGGLQQAVETLTSTWAEQDRKATESRKELYAQMTNLRIDFAIMAQSTQTIAQHGERIDKLEQLGDKATGAMWLGRIGMGAAAGAIGALLTKYGFK